MGHKVSQRGAIESSIRIPFWYSAYFVSLLQGTNLWRCAFAAALVMLFPTPWQLVLASTPPAPMIASRPRRSTVVVRITSLGLTQQWILDHVNRLCKHLGGGLVVVVDQSFCAGLACSPAWTARMARQATAFVYNSGEYASRWPLVRWPDLRHSTVWFREQSERFIKQLENASWPVSQGAGALQGQASTKAELLWPYLIHEPSVVLYWEHAVDRHKPLWVLEDDVAFYDPPRLVQYIDRMDDALDGVDYAAVFEAKSDNCSANLRPSWHLACNKARAWPVHKWEHVERFSPHMLSLLSNALDKGHVAHGELFASTLCRDTLFCKIRDFRAVDKASYDGITGGTYKKEAEELARGSRSRWTHVKHGTEVAMREKGWARAEWASLRERMELSAGSNRMLGVGAPRLPKPPKPPVDGVPIDVMQGDGKRMPPKPQGTKVAKPQGTKVAKPAGSLLKLPRPPSAGGRGLGHFTAVALGLT